jgi:hypothetical protein
MLHPKSPLDPAALLERFDLYMHMGVGLLSPMAGRPLVPPGGAVRAAALAGILELGKPLERLFGRAGECEPALLVADLLHWDRHQPPSEAEETPDR